MTNNKDSFTDAWDLLMDYSMKAIKISDFKHFRDLLEKAQDGELWEGYAYLIESQLDEGIEYKEEYIYALKKASSLGNIGADEILSSVIR